MQDRLFLKLSSLQGVCRYNNIVSIRLDQIGDGGKLAVK